MKLDIKRIIISIICGGGVGIMLILILKKIGIQANIEFLCPVVTILFVSNRKNIFK